MALVVRVLSQGWVHYRHSPLSMGDPAGLRGPRPGDRLPDQDVTCDGRRVRLHELTARPGVHVLLRRDSATPAPPRLGPRVLVHRIGSWPGDGLLAVRPDGHVGLRQERGDPEQLLEWLGLVGCGPRARTTDR
jgi:hypothetical protein